LHTDLAANSLNDSPNPHITDVHLPLRTSRLPMYGPKWTKILANYDNRLLKEEDQKDPFNVAGFYTQRNGKSPAIPASCKISSLLMCFRS
jgi:hypothetical protein